MPVRVIGLYSPAPGSGKTLIANQLRGHGFERLSFAAPLKEMAIVLLRNLGYTPSQASDLVYTNKDRILPEVGVSVRHILQTLGTEFGRDCIHPELWLRCFEERANSVLQADGLVIADDVRFPNEAALIRKLGGEMWLVHRPGVDNPHTHSSEGGLDEYPHFDRRIVNDGSVLDLYKQTTTALNLEPAHAR